MQALVTNLSSAEIPKTIQDALKDTNWSQATYEEMSALEKNATWEIVTKPRGKTIVGCKLVFTIKYKVDGSIKCYKVRLAAKGYCEERKRVNP